MPMAVDRCSSLQGWKMPPPRRFLFPVPKAAACTDLCSPACAFYLLCATPPSLFPELPPPPPPTNILLLHSTRVPIPLLAAAGALLLLSLIFCSLLFFFLLRRCRRRHDHQPAPAFPDGDNGVHYVWFIRSVGLDERAIGAIASCTYSKQLGGDGACAVCLADFRNGERLRLLPKCSHAFHLRCIDPWLRAHVSCPLCRAPAIGEPTPLVLPPSSPRSLTVELSSSSPALDDHQSVRTTSSWDGGPSVSPSSSVTGGKAPPDVNPPPTIRRSSSMGSLPWADQTSIPPGEGSHPRTTGDGDGDGSLWFLERYGRPQSADLSP